MKLTEPEKILIIRLSSIGDIILTTPLIRILRQQYPNAVIDFVIKSQYREILGNNPHLNNLITLDTSKGKSELAAVKKQIRNNNYNWIVDIHNNFRSRYLSIGLPGEQFRYKKYPLLRFLLVKFGLNFYPAIIPVADRYINSLAAKGIINDHAGTEFFIHDSDYKSIHDHLLNIHALDDGPVICVAPGAGFKTKRWPVEYYTKLVRELSAMATVFLLGDHKDRELTAAIKDCGERVYDFAGQYNIMHTACLIEHAQLLISNDSGLTHLAGALGKRTLTMFGPTTRELGFFPQQPGAVVMENTKLNCRPCTHIGSHTCPKGHFNCMLEITPEQVLGEAKQLL